MIPVLVFPRIQDLENCLSELNDPITDLLGENNRGLGKELPKSEMWVGICANPKGLVKSGWLEPCRWVNLEQYWRRNLSSSDWKELQA